MDPLSESEKDLTRLRLKIGQLEEEWEEIYESWDDWGNIQAVEEDLIPLIISTHAAVEDLTTHLILAYVVQEEFADGAFEYVYSEMSQAHREQLLVQCGILSKQTRGKIGNFRGLRNEVAHGTFMQLRWHRDNIPEKMNLVFEVLNSFEEAFTDGDLIDDIYEGEEKL